MGPDVWAGIVFDGNRLSRGVRDGTAEPPGYYVG